MKEVSTVGAREKIRVLIPLIKQLLKNMKPIAILIQEGQGPNIAYLHSIYVAGQDNDYFAGTAIDVKEMLKSALKYLNDHDKATNLTVRLLVGDTQNEINNQIDFLDNKYQYLQIA